MAFDATRDAICLGPVSAARHPGDGSVTRAPLACTDVSNAAARAALLASLNLVLTAEDLASLGLTEEDPRSLGITTRPAQLDEDHRDTPG